jgi:release factor glutamine methyltransferase
LTTVDHALRRGAALLRDAGIENPAREARLLLTHALGRPPGDLLLNRSEPVEAAAFDALLIRRARREPMAYILGRQGFWSLDFQVSRATLIPRADSETIVEAALGLPPPRRVLDLGTGTGCLLLAVLSERPDAFGVGVDLSPDAARLARANASALGLQARAAFLCGDWAAALAGRFDLVLSNPPYIETPAIPTLMPEVACHEPPRALDGGADGLDAYRAIIAALPDLLTPTGAAVLELGMGQGPAVAAMARQIGFATRTHPDLAGIVRAIVIGRELSVK